eukprot:scaffold103962_cov66-Phaeocystis_antarctica.AAC.2
MSAWPMLTAKLKTKTTTISASGPTERSSSRLVYPPSRHAPGMKKLDQSMSKTFRKPVHL